MAGDPVVVRFAPSPTGYLHVGSARTALFNYLFARHHGGTYRLRVEDTDQQRSTDAAMQAIYDGLRWLGIEHDGPVVIQSERAARHQEVAKAMVAGGHAYYCYATPEELEAFRQHAEGHQQSRRFVSPWRDGETAPRAGVAPTVRLRVPFQGSVTIEDWIQGSVTVQNDTLDDLVLLRADGTPTYMLAVVVDDHDMGITHIIRGDDHLTNSFRQFYLYHAMGWEPPQWAHIPLIHSPEGAKLSKRHGATPVDSYRAMGILPEAMINYLVRLGWSHGDDEIITREQAIAWFTLDHVGRSPSRLDPLRLEFLNSHYLRQLSASALVAEVRPFLPEPLSELTVSRMESVAGTLVSKVKTLVELAELLRPYDTDRAIVLTQEAEALVWDPALVAACEAWFWAERDHPTAESWLAAAKQFASSGGWPMAKVGLLWRVILTGHVHYPNVFETMAVMGKHAVGERWKAWSVKAMNGAP
jgi:glutamyl-tRNA synthetase